MASLLAALVERDSTIKQIESEMELVARGNDEVLTALNAKYERVKRLLCMMQVRRNPALPVSARFRLLCRQAHHQRTLSVCLFAAQGFRVGVLGLKGRFRYPVSAVLGMRTSSLLVDRNTLACCG
jgi:hypothetical protein